jgi:hypothetical protein
LAAAVVAINNNIHENKCSETVITGLKQKRSKVKKGQG